MIEDYETCAFNNLSIYGEGGFYRTIADIINDEQTTNWYDEAEGSEEYEEGNEYEEYFNDWDNFTTYEIDEKAEDKLKLRNGTDSPSCHIVFYRLDKNLDHNKLIDYSKMYVDCVEIYRPSLSRVCKNVNDVIKMDGVDYLLNIVECKDHKHKYNGNNRIPENIYKIFIENTNNKKLIVDTSNRESFRNFIKSI